MKIMALNQRSIVVLTMERAFSDEGESYDGEGYSGEGESEGEHNSNSTHSHWSDFDSSVENEESKDIPESEGQMDEGIINIEGTQ